MTLIEMIIYIGLLGLILFGSIFSAFSAMISEEHSQDQTETIDLTQNGGFIALIMALMISAALLVVVLGSSQNITVLFDEINHKQYRVSAVLDALTCLNLAMIEIEHDYFYHVDPPGLSYPDLHCSIISALGPVSTGINNPGNTRDIVVTGQSVITATVDARVLINSQNISLVSSGVIF